TSKEEDMSGIHADQKDRARKSKIIDDAHLETTNEETCGGDLTIIGRVGFAAAKAGLSQDTIEHTQIVDNEKLI
ncbi:hypothetical protein ACC794_37820, partial [Rhizobium ruizarguesonis]